MLDHRTHQPGDLTTSAPLLHPITAVPLLNGINSGQHLARCAEMADWMAGLYWTVPAHVVQEWIAYCVGAAPLPPT
jgi:hypothetical protein